MVGLHSVRILYTRLVAALQIRGLPPSAAGPETGSAEESKKGSSLPMWENRAGL